MAFVLAHAPSAAVAASAPVVSNVQAVQEEGSFDVTITYDLVDVDSDSLWVHVYLSLDGGATWPVLCTSVTGDVGPDVSPGSGRSIVWRARDDVPGVMSATSSIRVVANDELPHPYFASFWLSDLDGSNEMPLAFGDTIGFGQSFRVRWAGAAPSIAGMDPLVLASLDSVPPYDDGLNGAKYFFPGPPCIPTLEDCWQPRRFNEATGDSFSYFADISSLGFRNDGLDENPLHRLLPSGAFEFRLNTVDVFGLEVPEPGQSVNLVINYDPETIMLNGETDWAHPSDPEIYPYYIRLNDPAQVHYPFQAGDRIPDRTYVVVKALGRDDARDAVLDPGVGVGFTGSVRGTRSNYFGGMFSFATDASELNFAPAWGPNAEGWAADTLGFLTGPSTEFEVSMRSVDEHLRRDGTPATLSFEVGYPPCLQCIELLPKTSLPSAWSPSIACVDDPATHPCFQSVPEMRITQNGIGADDLEFVQPAYMLVHKQSYAVEVVNDPTGEEFDNYVLPANIYRMSVLLHGQDDPREAWPEAVRRTLGWQYQVDYACDPSNQIVDGGGFDDIQIPTWGEPGDGVGLTIDPTSGLWRLEIDVAVPTQLFQGPDIYLLLLTFVHAGNDPVIAQQIFDATTRQFGDGTVRAIALDQTKCGFNPIRPGKYHWFRGVRPSVSELPAGQTWRDCTLFIPDIKASLLLGDGAMASRDGQPVVKPFRLVVQTNAGDFVCATP
jgi:hypothetical protein